MTQRRPGRKREAEQDEPDVKDETFWTDERAEDGWDYLRDVVYGSVDGYAYMRSLAEFVAPSIYFDAVRKDMDADEDKVSDGDGRRDVAEEADVKPPRTRSVPTRCATCAIRRGQPRRHGDTRPTRMVTGRLSLHCSGRYRPHWCPIPIPSR